MMIDLELKCLLDNNKFNREAKKCIHNIASFIADEEASFKRLSKEEWQDIYKEYYSKLEEIQRIKSSSLIS